MISLGRTIERLGALGLGFYPPALLRLLGIMAVFTLLRAVFFVHNRDFFPDMDATRLAEAMLGGLRFDLVAVLYTNALFILLMALPFRFRHGMAYQRVAKWLFVTTNGIAIGMNCVDVAYFRFTLRRTTKTVVDEFRHEADPAGLLLSLAADYWPLALLALTLTYGLSRCYGGYVQRPLRFSPSWAYYSTGGAMLGLTAVLFVGGVRGGFAHSTRPITLSNAADHVQRPLEVALVLNTPFTVYKTLQRSVLQVPSFFASEEELDAEFTPVRHPRRQDTALVPMNVAVIILESFGKEYIGALNGTGRGYTPFLDSLIGEGMVFSRSFANGKKSIDAMPSVLASIPSMQDPYVLTPYASNRINSLASLLGGKGYRTAFYHGAPNGSMGFMAFARMAGYQRYVGKDEFADNRHYDGMWGIWDEEFMQCYAHSMDTMRQPFHTALFTVSSHHPFRVPERYAGVFPVGTLPIHRTIGYTDHALRQFFRTAAGMDWFANTLFVLTADHTNTDSEMPRYRTDIGAFEVPIILYRPDGSLRGISHRIAQQCDIMPTVLRVLGYDRPFVAFGQDAMGEDEEAFAVNWNGTYQLMMGGHLLQFNGTESTALYHFERDTMLRHNLLGRDPDRQGRMERKVRAFIQQYNGRMVDDRLLP